MVSLVPGTFLDSEFIFVGFLSDSDNVLVLKVLGIIPKGTNEGASAHEDDEQDEVEAGDHGVAAGFNVGGGVGGTTAQ